MSADTLETCPLPAGWQRQRAKYLFRLVDRRTAEEQARLLSVSKYYGIRPREDVTDRESRSETTVDYKIVRRGDLVVNIMLAWDGALGFALDEGVVSPAYDVYECGPSIRPEFFDELFRTKLAKVTFTRRSKGIIPSRWRTYSEDFLDMRLPVPPIDEQTQLGSMMRREAARIDALIAQKERFLALLEEKRQALVSHAVTKGLDPDAPVRESGHQMLGDVRESFDVVQLRRVLTRIEQGWSPQCDEREAGEDEWGVLKAGAVNAGVFNEHENKTLPSSLQPEQQFEVREGDVLMNRASGSADLVGSAAIVRATRSRLLLCDKLYRLHPSSNVEPRFLAYALQSRPIRAQIVANLSGGDGLAQNISQEKVRALRIPLPAPSEQRKIADYIDNTIAKHARLDKITGRSITLLRERRQSLITSAVTGQLDPSISMPQEART